MRAVYGAAFVVCVAGCGGGGGGSAGPAVPPPGATPSPAPGIARAVHSATITMVQPYPALGAAATIAVTVTAKGANGVVIAAPDSYTNPITVTDDDASGHTSLTRTVLLAPSDPIALRYDGGYFPITKLRADWTDPIGGTAAPFRQISAGIASVESSVGAGHSITSVTRGGDGAIWFADQLGSIGRSAAGSTTFYPVGGGWQPITVAAGTDRAIWFVTTGAFNVVGPSQGVGRIALDGTLGPVWQTSSPYGSGIVVAADGTAYFNQLNNVTRITTAGAMSNVRFTVNGSTAHTDTLAAGSDGGLYATAVGMLLRYDLTSGTQTSAAFPVQSSGSPIEPGLLLASDDGHLYYDDKGTAIFGQSLPGGAPVLLGRGSATPGQGGALGPTAMALAPDHSVWFSSLLMTVDAHPIFGHAVGGAVQMLVGQSAVARQNGNAQDVPPSSIALGSDGRMWYSRNDALGSFVP
jgi:streptogramin lyase